MTFLIFSEYENIEYCTIQNKILIKFKISDVN